MKILVITGSRNPKGQTAKATGALIKGLKDANHVKTQQVGSNVASVEEFLLPRMKIERCRQCNDDGWGICRTEGKCIINDDFKMLVDRIKDSEFVVFATPVYFSDLSESLNAFLGRLRRICINEASKRIIEGKRAIGICVAGGSGGGAPECAVILEKNLKLCSFDLVDIIPVKRQNLDEKLSFLKSIGKSLATS